MVVSRRECGVEEARLCAGEVKVGFADGPEPEQVPTADAAASTDEVAEDAPLRPGDAVAEPGPLPLSA